MNEPGSSVEVHTFLIADVRGYTAYTLERGDEAAARLAARFAEIVEEAVAPHDGKVIELRGDEALAIFRSTRGALRASLDLQARLTAEIERDPSVPLNVGVGLDAGEAVPVGDGFRGAALNMAARLCSLAGPGEILASDGVVHLARRVEGIVYTERGSVQLKGFSDPVRVVRVEGEAAGGETAEASPPRPAAHQDLPIGGFLGALPASPLVSRAHELTHLNRIVDEVAGGTGRVVLISGEPGVGKTRLSQEVTLEVRNRGFAIAAGRCYEAHATIAFYAFIEALTALYAVAPPAFQSEIPRRWPDLARLLPSLGLPAAGDSAPPDQQRLFWAVTALIQGIAAAEPVSLLLDDLHWADAATLDLLQHLARHTRRDRVLLLGTFRDVEVNRQHPLEAALRDLQREGLVERIDLKRLEREATSELIATSFGEETISDEFTDLVYRRTEGNPFFVQQVMRVLVERGDLYRQDGAWTRKDVEAIEVPESIRSVVGQRLSRLATDTQELLAEASVLGQTFEFDTLLAIAGRPEEDIEAALGEAGKAGLVRETGADRYSFDHALTQQSLYAEISTRRRRRLHRGAGEALEELPPRRRQGRAAEMAWHFLQGDDAERALRWSLTAGDEATGLFAWSDAEMHFRTAVEVARELESRPEEALGLEKLGSVLVNLGKWGEALDVLAAAAAIYRVAGNAEGELRAAALSGDAHGWRGTRLQGIELLTETLDRAGSSSSQAAIETEIQLARLHFLEGDASAALTLSQRALEAARALGDRKLMGQAQMRRASSLTLSGRADEAFEGYHEAIALAEETNDLVTLSNALNNLLGEHYRRMEIAEGDAVQKRQLEVVRRLGSPGALAFALQQLGLVYWSRGQLQGALDAYSEAASIARFTGPSRASAVVAHELEVRLYMGDESALDGLRALAVEGDPRQRAVAGSVLAGWSLLHDRPEEALRWLGDTLDDPVIEPQERSELTRFVSLADLRLGATDEVERVATDRIEESETEGNDRRAFLWRRVLMLVRVAQHRLDEARSLSDEIHERTRMLGLVMVEAETLHEYGSALVRVGEIEVARGPLQESLDLFRRIGSPPLIRSAEELLATASAPAG